MKEMKQLQDKATSFILGVKKNWMPCELFYRDKDDEYYEYCRHRWNGFLPPVLKNENGDPASPLLMAASKEYFLESTLI